MKKLKESYAIGLLKQCTEYEKEIENLNNLVALEKLKRKRLNMRLYAIQKSVDKLKKEFQL
jgi:hypothetical protein